MRQAEDDYTHVQDIGRCSKMELEQRIGEVLETNSERRTPTLNIFI